MQIPARGLRPPQGVAVASLNGYRYRGDRAYIRDFGPSIRIGSRNIRMLTDQVIRHGLEAALPRTSCASARAVREIP